MNEIGDFGATADKRPDEIVLSTTVEFFSQHAKLPGTYVHASHVG